MSATHVIDANETEILRLAVSLMKENDFENAVSHLKCLLNSDAKHDFATDILVAAYAQLKMKNRAEEYYKRVLALNPANMLAQFQLGMLQFSAQQPQYALHVWKSCLDEPNDFLAHFHSAIALMQLNKPDEARAFLEKSIRRAPQDHWLYPEIQSLLTSL